MIERALGKLRETGEKCKEGARGLSELAVSLRKLRAESVAA
jgi:hypothetical protein